MDRIEEGYQPENSAKQSLLPMEVRMPAVTMTAPKLNGVL